MLSAEVKRESSLPLVYLLSRAQRKQHDVGTQADHAAAMEVAASQLSSSQEASQRQAAAAASVQADLQQQVTLMRASRRTIICHS